MGRDGGRKFRLGGWVTLKARGETTVDKSARAWCCSDGAGLSFLRASVVLLTTFPSGKPGKTREKIGSDDESTEISSKKTQT